MRKSLSASTEPLLWQALCSASPQRYWKLGTLWPQAELQGLGGGLPPDMQYAGPPVSGICLGAHEQTPSYGSNSTTALWSPSG